MSVLTAKARNRLPAGAFAGPGRTYPDEDRTHAEDAKARAKQALDTGHIDRAQYNRIVGAANRKLAQSSAGAGAKK